MSRLFVIQPSAFTERFMPYPILADEESGLVADQETWNGRPHRVIGFVRDLVVRPVDLPWQEATKNPSRALGMYLVVSDKAGNWGFHTTTTVAQFNVIGPLSDAARRGENDMNGVPGIGGLVFPPVRAIPAEKVRPGMVLRGWEEGANFLRKGWHVEPEGLVVDERGVRDLPDRLVINSLHFLKGPDCPRFFLVEMDPVAQAGQVVLQTLLDVSIAEYDPGDGTVAEVYLDRATQRIVERLAAAGLLNSPEAAA